MRPAGVLFCPDYRSHPGRRFNAFVLIGKSLTAAQRYAARYRCLVNVAKLDGKRQLSDLVADRYRIEVDVTRNRVVAVEAVQ